MLLLWWNIHKCATQKLYLIDGIGPSNEELISDAEIEEKDELMGMAGISLLKGKKY